MVSKKPVGTEEIEYDYRRAVGIVIGTVGYIILASQDWLTALAVSLIVFAHNQSSEHKP